MKQVIENFYIIQHQKTVQCYLQWYVWQQNRQKVLQQKSGKKHLIVLNYAVMHIHATLRYHSNRTIMHMESDLSYL